MPPTGVTVHPDQFLGTISLAFQNPAYISEKILPIVPSDKQHDLFPIFSKQHFRVRPTSRAPGVQSKTIEIDLDKRGSFFCDGHSQDAPMPVEIQSNADPAVELDIEVTEKVTEIIRIDQENNAAAVLTNPSTITSNTTLSGTSQWSDFQNSNPKLAIQAQMRSVMLATGLRPNRLLIGWDVYVQLQSHPIILDALKYTGGVKGEITPQMLAQYFGLEEVIVPQSMKQGANMGQTDSLSFIWGKVALLFYAPANPGKRTPALGYTFVWMTNWSGNGLGGDINSKTGGFLVYKYFDWKSRSWILGVDFYYDQHIIIPGAAYLWLSAVA